MKIQRGTNEDTKRHTLRYKEAHMKIQRGTNEDTKRHK
jgi:hypothetical protein